MFIMPQYKDEDADALDKLIRAALLLMEKKTEFSEEEKNALLKRIWDEIRRIEALKNNQR